MKPVPGLKHSQSHGWQKHRVVHFWRPVKENTVVLQLSIEGLPNAVVTVVESHCLVMSHCHGFYPNSQFCAQLQRYCGMDAVGGERALTAASDASREPMMLMRRSRVHSGAIAQSGNYWPHLLDRGTDPSALERYRIKQSSICTFMRAGGRAGTQSVSCCVKICQRGTEHGQTILIWQNRTTDSLRTVQKKLIRALPPWPRW